MTMISQRPLGIASPARRAHEWRRQRPESTAHTTHAAQTSPDGYRLTTPRLGSLRESRQFASRRAQTPAISLSPSARALAPTMAVRPPLSCTSSSRLPTALPTVARLRRCRHSRPTLPLHHRRRRFPHHCHRSRRHRPRRHQAQRRHHPRLCPRSRRRCHTHLHQCQSICAAWTAHGSLAI